MPTVTIIWSMTTAACLTLALLHFLVWCNRREAWGSLLFSISATGTAFVAWCEWRMMGAQTTTEFGEALRWTHLPAWAMILALVGFVYIHLRAGRRWLAWTVCSLRTFSLILNFCFTPNLNFREITALRSIPFLGETVSLGQGVENPWMLVGQASLVLLVVFIVDASIAVWRRGDRRQAVILGGSMSLFVTLGSAQTILSLWGVIPSPITASLLYTVIVAAMGFELSRDLLRAAALASKLRESEQRMSLAVDAASMGIWIRDLERDEIWASNKWRDLFGFGMSEHLEMNKVLQRVHPDDRVAFQDTLARAVANNGSYETEFRLRLPDGALRWILSRGRVEFNSSGRPLRVRGASRDHTADKLIEQQTRDLSGRLIHAQEQAQRQLARELHDDLSQSLALVSVELDLLAQTPWQEAEAVAAKLEGLSSQVKALSSEVHRLSHDLHPAKLEQLGLGSAVRGFCKEFARAQHIAIDFVERDVPRVLPGDAALSLYRITQETLNNVVKHSGATAARVEMTRSEGEIRLVVTDDGEGFDPVAATRNGSLGLVSMNERARFAGGSLFIESQPDSGTRVEVRVPVGERVNCGRVVE